MAARPPRGVGRARRASSLRARGAAGATPARPSPPRKRALATAVLEKLCHVGSKPRRREATSLGPAMVRSVVFTTAAKALASLAREDVVSRAAAELNACVADVEEALFADLPGERRVAGPPADLSPAQLALRTNLALARALLFRSRLSVTIEIDGNARSLVRYARLRGLICTPEQKDCALRSPSPVLWRSFVTRFCTGLLGDRAIARLVRALPARRDMPSPRPARPTRAQRRRSDFPVAEAATVRQSTRGALCPGLPPCRAGPLAAGAEPEAIPLAGGAVILPRLRAGARQRSGPSLATSRSRASGPRITSRESWHSTARRP